MNEYEETTTENIDVRPPFTVAGFSYVDTDDEEVDEFAGYGEPIELERDEEGMPAGLLAALFGGGGLGCDDPNCPVCGSGEPDSIRAESDEDAGGLAGFFAMLEEIQAVSALEFLLKLVMAGISNDEVGIPEDEKQEVFNSAVQAFQAVGVKYSVYVKAVERIGAMSDETRGASLSDLIGDNVDEDHGTFVVEL